MLKNHLNKSSEKLAIITLIKHSKTEKKLKDMLINIVNTIVVDNEDIEDDYSSYLDDLEAYIENTKSRHSVQPKTKDELKDIIDKTIKEQGNKCDLNFIDTSLITDMSEMFADSKFNGDISKWNVSNVKNMRYMFSDSKFNGDISNWNVSNVENMECMFYDSKFNGDISKWNVSNVTNTFGMFAKSKFKKDIKK